MVAAMITYLGSIDSTRGGGEEERGRRVADWQKIVNVSSKSAQESPREFDFATTMVTASQFLAWKSDGLDAATIEEDALTVENAVSLLHSPMSPLIVDPSMRMVVQWLKAQLIKKGGEKDAVKVECVNLKDASFVRTLELALRFGKKLLVLEVDEVEPFLLPILRKDFLKQGLRQTVVVGEKRVEVGDDFQIFLVTRNPSLPHLLAPATSAVLSPVNFTVTRRGLAGRLLSLAVKHEQPHLEREKTALVEKEEALKLELSEMEESMLGRLVGAEGNLLENKELLASLTATKSHSIVISEALAESQRIQASLQQERLKYWQLAECGSRLYFSLKPLSALNHMYQFSLEFVVSIFQQVRSFSRSCGCVAHFCFLLSRDWCWCLAVTHVGKRCWNWRHQRTER